VSRLFEQPASAEDWKKHRLSDDQVRFFHEQGYLAGVRLSGGTLSKGG